MYYDESDSAEGFERVSELIDTTTDYGLTGSVMQRIAY